MRALRRARRTWATGRIGGARPACGRRFPPRPECVASPGPCLKSDPCCQGSCHRHRHAAAPLKVDAPWTGHDRCTGRRDDCRPVGKAPARNDHHHHAGKASAASTPQVNSAGAALVEAATSTRSSLRSTTTAASSRQGRHGDSASTDHRSRRCPVTAGAALSNPQPFADGRHAARSAAPAAAGRGAPARKPAQS